ncbi:unnamed protein product [Amoebophrya sp. A25]|nr:unnamed protein product [Amoebophrya sp. A25]|eukprot:GSA25T00007184001.1
MSRFQFLASDSDSESESEQVPNVAPANSRGVVSPPASQAAPTAQAYFPSHEFGLAEEGAFHAVPKKKAHNMKADPKLKANMEELMKVDKAAPPMELVQTPVYANGNHGAAPAANGKVSPVKSPLGKPGADLVSSQNASPQKGKAKKKKAANNRFACFVDSDDEGDQTDSDVGDEETPIAETVAPVLPKDLGLTKEAQPDYYGIVHIETTTKPDRDPLEELKKPFVTETVFMNVLFVNSKTKKSDFEFKKLVRPTIFPQLSPQTTQMTSITNADLDKADAQPIDEVLRMLDRFLKEKNLVPTFRKKKPSMSQIQNTQQEFVLVTYGAGLEVKDDFRKDLAKKGLQAQQFWKRWIDLRKTFEDNYQKKAATLGDMLQAICLEFKGVPHVDDAANIAVALAAMLQDIPHKLEMNMVAK